MLKDWDVPDVYGSLWLPSPVIAHFKHYQKICELRQTARSCCTKINYLDTVEVWGSSPHVPTILFSSVYAGATDILCSQTERG